MVSKCERTRTYQSNETIFKKYLKITKETPLMIDIMIYDQGRLTSEPIS